MTQAPTPGPLHDSDCSHDGYEVDTADQPIRCAECGQSLSPTAPVEASGSGWEADAWKWLGQLYPNDAPSDLAYDANEMVDAFLAGSGRSDRMAKALERIADEQQYRSGYCQTDITVEPALTAEEAQTVARDALSTTPARPLALGGQQGEDEIAFLLDRLADFENDINERDWYGHVAPAIARVKAALSTTPARAEAQDEGAATDDLVDRFAVALKAKLRAAGEKYGFDDAWKADDWRDKLIEDLLRHIQKGDPRDVAAYCAFAWHHDWSLSPKQDDLRSAAFTDRGAEDRYVSQDEGAAGELRKAGWSVAVHNDYRLHGEAHTFWLWTHPDGRWIKGEGRNDADALSQCLAVMRAHPSPPPAADADRVRSVACLTRYSPLSTGNNKAMMQEDEAGLYVLRKQALAALKSEGK